MFTGSPLNEVTMSVHVLFTNLFNKLQTSLKWLNSHKIELRIKVKFHIKYDKEWTMRLSLRWVSSRFQQPLQRNQCS